jgi:hypothetical protein
VLTEGQAHDAKAYDDLMAERDSDPGAMLGDKGYDSDAIRHDLRDRGAAPEIPTKRNRKVQHSVSKGFMRYVPASSASSGISRNSAALPHGSTRPPVASSASSYSAAFASGSGLSTEPKLRAASGFHPAYVSGGFFERFRAFASRRTIA